MIDFHSQVVMHLASLKAAGLLFITPSRDSSMLLGHSSAPQQSRLQFRRCATCKASMICEPSPSTALPCPCGGECLLSPLTVDDIISERMRCGEALDRLAATCEKSGDPNGKVTAAGAALHMRKLADWMRGGS